MILTIALILCFLGCSQLGAIEPCDPGPANISFTVDSGLNQRPISPLIYGSNFNRIGNTALTRLGGNRYTAYNWENNASNAGSDYFHQNDAYLSSSNTPGAAVRPAIQQAGNAGQAIIVTAPMAGYVAADKNGGGDVANTPNYLQTRFKQLVPKKGAPFTLAPSTSDAYVYSDEFVNWVETSARVSPQQQILYALDNEPDLWSETHARIHPQKTTYQELVDRTLAYAGGIKDVKSDALVLGAVNYGWQGYRTLQDAPDRAGRDFHEYFLAAMKQAETTGGRRLLDALDIHWYPEAQSTAGVRITEGQTDADSVTARVQAPRSLWDPTYTEKSWISQWSTSGPIKMLTRVNEDITQFYPGTKLAITEYNYGASQHISGGIAQADVLGIFGREGVYAAAWWDLTSGSDQFVQGAFDMYRNYDGAGAKFGSTSVASSTNNIANSAIHASIDPADPNRMTIIAINRSGIAQSAALRVTHDKPFSVAEVYQLTSATAQPVQQPDIPLTALNALVYQMPAYSVSMLVLTRTPLAGDFNDDGLVDARDYTVWRDGLGTLFTPAQYDVWRVNFGATWPTVTAAAQAVPEIAAGPVLLIAMGAMLVRDLCGAHLVDNSPTACIDN